MSAAARKTTEATTEVPVGALVPQPHGGAIRNGGTNKGGPGTMPSVVRLACRESFHKRRPILERIADGKVKQASIKERIAAIRTLGMYAGLEKSNTIKKAHPDVIRRVDATLDWLQHTPLISEEHREQAIKEMDAIWGGK